MRTFVIFDHMYMYEYSILLNSGQYLESILILLGLLA